MKIVVNQRFLSFSEKRKVMGTYDNFYEIYKRDELLDIKEHIMLALFGYDDPKSTNYRSWWFGI